VVHLGWIHFLDNQIEGNGAKCIAQALGGNATLTTLNLICTSRGIHFLANQIGDEGANSIANALDLNSSLTTLYIRGTLFSIHR
jgi:hypothetical protein